MRVFLARAAESYWLEMRIKVDLLIETLDLLKGLRVIVKHTISCQQSTLVALYPKNLIAFER